MQLHLMQLHFNYNAIINAIALNKIAFALNLYLYHIKCYKNNN
jgi:ABC-type uncharacterized transport system permease subunit